MSKRARLLWSGALLMLGAVTLTADIAPLQSAPHSLSLTQIVDGMMVCRLATRDEEQAFARADVPLHVMYPEQGHVRLLTAGLRITLMGTAQLEANPAAKAAFIRAAQKLESRIANPVDVTIRVDFGATRFGVAYPEEGPLASADSRWYYAEYPAARSALIAGAITPAETTLYNQLPFETVPTDLGAARWVLGALVQLKTLGFTMPADVYPDIGFNSAYSFDFDPSNGISPGRYDFDALVTHELGHILGFVSFVGLRELEPSYEVSPTIWDLFRFRPGVSMATFSSASRPMSSGGQHVSFFGGPSLAMSTARPDGTGGDGRQSSHWKDNTEGNPPIGLMDPTLPSATRLQLTQNDLDAFGVMGYSLAGGGSTPGTPVPSAPTNLTATATSSTAIRLDWTDNASNESGFVVERKVGGSFTVVGNPAANATQFNITSLSPGTTYTFRVKARNGAGDSPYSNEASATTTSSGGTTCTPNATTICLLNDRFRVSIAYVNPFTNPPNQPGNFLGARLLQGVQNPDTGVFGFSSAQAVEVVVRIQDARPFAQRFDVYYGGMTDVGYTVTVTDTKTGMTRQYANQVGRVGGGVDRTSFPASVFGSSDRILTSGGRDSLPVERSRTSPGKKRTPLRLSAGTTADAAEEQTRLSANAGSGGACNESEPNQTVDSADPIPLATPCSGSATFADLFQYVIDYTDGSEGRVHDVFEVRTAATGPLTVNLTFTNASADLDILFFTYAAGVVEIIDNSAGSTTTESFTTGSLAAGTYYIGVSAFSGGSNYILTATGSGGGSVPAAPSNLKATGTSASVIRLDWTDNSNNETSFVVEQKTATGFVALNPPLAADSTAFNVTGFSANTTATFRVKARNTSGDSPYSNEATGTTFGSGGTGCTANSTTVCLLSNRFRVTITYVNPFSNPPNQPGTFLAARLLQGTQNPDTALFGFSSAYAVEVVVRVQDTRPFAPRFDIYYGGITDVGYTVTVTDTQTGTTRQYSNTVGQVGGGVDRTSFPAN